MCHSIIHSVPVIKLGKGRSEKREHRGRNSLKLNHYFLRSLEVTGKEENEIILFLPLLCIGAHI